jgi:hypothetical protein
MAVTGIFILRTVIASGDHDQVQILSLPHPGDDIGDKLLTVIRGSILKDQPYRLFLLGVSDHSSFPYLSKALIP